MKKLLLFFMGALLSAGSLDSQTKTNSKTVSTAGDGMSGYKTSIGIRFGYEAGLTLKHFIQERRAIEGILSAGWGGYGFRLTGLYEVHKAFPGVEGLDWYFGGGLHVGSYNSGYYGYYGGYYNGSTGYYDRRGRWHSGTYNARQMVVGIDGILGLEYQFDEAPFSISLDIKPYIDFIGYSGRYGDGALSLRYTIK
jgi:hypothetical protein